MPRACAENDEGVKTIPHAENQVSNDHFKPFRLNTPAVLVSGEAGATRSNGRWGKEVASFMPNAVHVIVPGAGHTPDNDCTRSIRHALFRSGATKGLDTGCIAKLQRPAFQAPQRLSRDGV
jgi:pimeloyl-ACP methyl ester carboxylesterase